MSENNKAEFHKNHKVKRENDYNYKYDSSEMPKKIDGKYIFNEIVHIFNFDKGIFYTIKELIIRPGKSILYFIQKDRSKLVKPITYILFCSLFYTITQKHLINNDFLNVFGRGYNDSLGLKESALVNILKWTKNNYGYTNILMSIFIALWIKLFFRKFSYNLFEILTLLLYVLGTSTLIYSVFIILDILTNYKLLFWGGTIGFIYSSYAIAQFYNKNKVLNYFKGAIANFLGMITFYFIPLIVGIIIDIILNSN